MNVPHVGQGGADNICWDPQHGGISLNTWIVYNDCSCEMIFVILTALHVYLPYFYVLLTVLL